MKESGDTERSRPGHLGGPQIFVKMIIDVFDRAHKTRMENGPFFVVMMDAVDAPRDLGCDQGKNRECIPLFLYVPNRPRSFF